MGFTVTFREHDSYGGLASKSFEDAATFAIRADNGVLVTVGGDRSRTHWSPGYWVSVTDTQPESDLG
jgi:hypothetical protein